MQGPDKLVATNEGKCKVKEHGQGGLRLLYFAHNCRKEHRLVPAREKANKATVELTYAVEVFLGGLLAQFFFDRIQSLFNRVILITQSAKTFKCFNQLFRRTRWSWRARL
jgi:hypothetical protein